MCSSLLSLFFTLALSSHLPPSLILLCFRQEKLLQLAEKFARKAALRESWLSDMGQVLQELDKGKDKSAVDAALKRHEAISADVHVGVRDSPNAMHSNVFAETD